MKTKNNLHIKKTQMGNTHLSLFAIYLLCKCDRLTVRYANEHNLCTLAVTPLAEVIAAGARLSEAQLAQAARLPQAVPVSARQ